MERAFALLVVLAGCLPAPPGRDFDGDGVSWPEDCDDGDGTVHPGAEDVPYDGVDQDCKGDSDYDVDGDGADAEDWGGMDCDDEDPAILPGAKDAPCDGVDQDCDGAPEGDVDGDGVDGEDCGGDDCDDGNAEVFPGAVEAIDGFDNDCDGVEDEVPWNGGPWEAVTYHTGLHGHAEAMGAFGAAIAPRALDAVGMEDVGEGTLLPDPDGMPDLLASAPSDQGLVLVVPGGPASGLELANVYDRTALVLRGDDATLVFGATVAWIPDLEGDSVPEILVGAPATDSSTGEGRALLFPSLSWGSARVGAAGVHEIEAMGARLILEGDEAGDGFGRATVLVDPDNDLGFGAAVCSPLADATREDVLWKYPGEVAIFDAQALRTEGVLRTSAAALRIGGTVDAEYAGAALPVAFDLDGSGMLDIAVSAPGGVLDRGLIGVLLGEDLTAGAVSIEDLGFQARGGDTRGVGQALAGGGDMDGDGYDDLALISSTEGGTAPVLEVLSGEAWWRAPVADTDDVRLLRVDWASPLVLAKPPPLDLSASINGDGYDDLVLGAPGTPLGIGDGPVLIWYGRPDVPATADTAQAEASLFGPEDSSFGSLAVATADLADTGFPMLLVGAPDEGIETYPDMPPGAIYVLDPLFRW